MAYRVYAEVNLLKHDPKGLATGRKTTVVDGLKGMSEVTDLIERRLNLSGQVVP